VAVVEAAITALGGAPTIRQAKSWDFQIAGQGTLANGATREVLSATKAAKSGSPPPGGEPSEKLPYWLKQRSPLVPALVGTILVEQLQGSRFSIEIQETQDRDGLIAVVFSRTIGSRRTLSQVWYFDKATNLPTWIWFREPVKMGDMESFRDATVSLSDYRAVGGVLHPHRIETIQQRYMERETLTLQSLVPSADAGGIQ
jgi:hypothetical protein